MAKKKGDLGGKDKTDFSGPKKNAPPEKIAKLRVITTGPKKTGYPGPRGPAKIDWSKSDFAGARLIKPFRLGAKLKISAGGTAQRPKSKKS